MSAPAPNPQQDKIFTFTITGDNGNVQTFTRTADTADFGSLTNNAASFESDFTRTTAGTAETTTSGASVASVTQSESIPTIPSTLLTSTTPTQDSASAAPEASGVSSGSNGENPSVSDKACNSISCNAGLQAAIAVPVVVISLLILLLAFCCIRRRKRRQAGREDVAVASMSEKRKKLPKKWSRHLRIFSFDAELLMGGRFSSSNSLRSRETGSQRSGQRAHTASPSIHSVDEEVAPPYRDAISHTQPPSTVPMALGATPTTSDPFPRPNSVATASTAPPAYPAASGATAAGAGATGLAAVTNLSRASSRASTTSQTPVSTRSLNDPFRNDIVSPVSPDDTRSPFLDPPISPSQSIRRPRGDDFDDAQSTISSVAEVASLREAQVGRKLSTNQGRRV
ncbi:uncharacterized protein AB675_6477 [Cyphellophora attinorum]|uniref:Uncharacterized protein n=1 Tax=Cyphellophora attinorum TaxID=1664694 RepID=A0A0N1H9A4_9EURO|nr:uncharacterized protein AB675_6477 [Phialophora attinorum]KPI43970.1 hypothetical protein AB675_6477 [Phialophora attinorum]